MDHNQACTRKKVVPADELKNWPPSWVRECPVCPDLFLVVEAKCHLSLFIWKNICSIAPSPHPPPTVTLPLRRLRVAMTNGCPAPQSPLCDFSSAKTGKSYLQKKNSAKFPFLRWLGMEADPSSSGDSFSPYK